MTIQMILAKNCVLSARNVRHTAADPARLETLKASIAERGVLQNLIGFAVPKKKGKFEITAGGRRLAAVHALIDAGTMPADTVVPVFVMNDIATAGETSLAENFERAAMNPADECVAFRHFIEVEKSTPEDIAKRFGLTTRFVEGRIRLAGLADDVFEALRSGSITLDAAQAFATTTDLARQSRVYEQVKNSWNGIDAGAVRRLMVSETMVASDATAMFVGREAYVAAGGRVECDLFADNASEIWLDKDIVTALAQAKMAEAAAAVTGFATVVPTLGNRPDWSETKDLRPVTRPKVPLTEEQEARLAAIADEVDAIETAAEEEGSTEESETRYEALQAEAESIENGVAEIDDEIKAKATAFMVIGPDGTATLHTTVYVDPKAVDPVTPSAAGATVDAVEIGRVLRDELAVQRTQLLGLHLANDPGMAIDLAIFLLADATVSIGRSFDRGSSLSGSAATRAPIGYKPTGVVVDQLQLLHDGLDYSWAEPKDTGVRFDAFRALGDEQRSAWAGWVVARTLEPKLADEPHAAFHNHLGRLLGIDVAAWWRPTAANFFTRVKKTIVLKAMTAIGGSELAARYANAKKADLAEAAEKLCAGRTIVEANVQAAALNWVPDEMGFATPDAGEANLDNGDDAGDAHDNDDDGNDADPEAPAEQVAA